MPEELGIEGPGGDPDSDRLRRNSAIKLKIRMPSQPAFLQVPPFPGSRAAPLTRPAPQKRRSISGAEIDELLGAIRSEKVGGTYWASHPDLPANGYRLLRIRDPQTRQQVLAEMSAGETVSWVDDRCTARPGEHLIVGPADPWHLVDGASRVVVDSDDDLALVAAISKVAVTTVGRGAFEQLHEEGGLHDAVRARVLAFDYSDPYTHEAIDATTAVSLCGFWRRTIESNRSLAGALGFAFWKRPTVAALLWAGTHEVRFLSTLSSARKGDRVAAWMSKAPRSSSTVAESTGIDLVEVEDGFIRSSGLGADCVAPLSIVVDPVGIHFDPSRPSGLERLLQEGPFHPDLVSRARRLRRAIVGSGMSKYETAHSVPRQRAGDRVHILVPGQVEDDRAVVAGGCGLQSNLLLLERVRERSPHAHIIYKPHPDVEAGHRRGAIPDETCREFADEIGRGEPISALLDAIDEVHVNTSLAGFEALLREKPVTTYGVPFYAGWGLTTDLGPVPSRRTAKRSLDELVAAALLLYPRYLDPLTGLPCPAEVLIDRLSAGVSSTNSPIVRLRRLQGRCRRSLTALRRLVTAQ